MLQIHIRIAFLIAK